LAPSATGESEFSRIAHRPDARRNSPSGGIAIVRLSIARVFAVETGRRQFRQQRACVQLLVSQDKQLEFSGFLTTEEERYQLAGELR